MEFPADSAALEPRPIPVDTREVIRAATREVIKMAVAAVTTEADSEDRSATDSQRPSPLITTPAKDCSARSSFRCDFSERESVQTVFKESPSPNAEER